MHKELVINCKCDTSLCDHAAKEVSKLLQETFDDGYDEGWISAYEHMREAMVEAGVPGVEDLIAPPPPGRSGVVVPASRKARKKEQLIN